VTAGEAQRGNAAGAEKLDDRPSGQRLLDRLVKRFGGPSNIQDIYPLTPMQQALLLASDQGEENSFYVSTMSCSLVGALDVDAYKRAWETLVGRHNILRSALILDLAVPVQVVLRTTNLSFRSLDWRGLNPELNPDRLKELEAEERRQSIDLERPPLMRIVLVRISEQLYRFVWTAHHAILDGWSIPILLRDLAEIYAAQQDCRSPQLNRAPSYKDYVAWLQKRDLQQDARFWKAALEDAPTVVLPEVAREDARGAANVQRAEIRHTFSAELTRLKRFASEQRTTPNVVLMAAWALVLGRWSGSKDVTFGVTVSGRPPELPDVEDSVGVFINTLPFRVTIRPEMSVGSWLATVSRTQEDLLAHQYAPLSSIASWVRQGAGSAPLFETTYVLENYPARKDSAALSGVRAQDFDGVDVPHFPFNLLFVTDDKLWVRCIHDAGRFGGMAHLLLADLDELLATLMARPEARLCDTDPELSSGLPPILALWNDNSTSYPRVSVGEAFATSAREHPAAVALVAGDRRLTYAELDGRSDALAARLVAYGVGLEDVVGLCFDRSVEMVVGLIAVLKAGGAYMPLDPAYPPERLRFMISDCAPKVLLTHSPAHHALKAALDGLPAAPAILDVGTLGPEGAAMFMAERRPGPDNLAYVMYTSGSTGRPKGVAVTHRGILRLVSRPNYVSIGREDVFLQLAPLAFDASTFEIWGALLNGARLVLYPHRDTDPEEIQACVADHGVTILWLTAGLFHETVGVIARPSSPIRQLLAGGDVVLPADVRLALAKIPHLSFINGYGPTECATFSVCHRVRREAALGPNVPIGRPISDTQAYVLDQRLEPVPFGSTGNLHIAGDGLARCYLGQAGLTADRFIANPFISGARMYSTGDRVRWQGDGTVEFLGRSDRQVKIRGFRIELGEVEARLAACHATSQAAVVVNERDGDKRIIAHVVLAPGGSVADIQAELIRVLPAYMMPSAIFAWDSFPVTSIGKVDRAALTASGTRPTEVKLAEPANGMEELLRSVWAEALDLQTVDVETNFFELGGHSLLASRVTIRLREMLQIKLPLRTLFDFPTIRALSEEIMNRHL